MPNLREGQMLERFSDAARRAVVLAHQEAKQLGTEEICGEHILLGLAAVSEGVGAQALLSAGIGLEDIRHHVEELTGRARQPSEHVSFGGPTMRVFRFSEREAGQLGHDYAGTGHVLLGLIQDRERVAAQVLIRLTRIWRASAGWSLTVSRPARKKSQRPIVHR
jgi:ATP-dependent Clp protease ATP-binding subunit ClpC